MALVTITYNAWDHNRQVIPAAQLPEISFRPVNASMVSGLMTAREVQGTLNASTGAGSVQLESMPGLLYVPVMRWHPPGNSWENQEFAYNEWSPFHPDNGGDISDLSPAQWVGLMWIGPTPPPGGAPWPESTRWLDSGTGSADFGWIKKWVT